MKIETLTNTGILWQERFDEKWMPEPFSGCWIWTGAMSGDGYGRFQFLGKNQKSNRVAWQLFRGDIPDGLCVLHHCDTRACVNPDHLFLGTHADNSRDCVAKGRHHSPNRKYPKGEEHPMCKLTSGQVLAIRLDPRSRRIIAKHYGVSHFAINQIKLKRTWRHI